MVKTTLVCVCGGPKFEFPDGSRVVSGGLFKASDGGTQPIEERGPTAGCKDKIRTVLLDSLGTKH